MTREYYEMAGLDRPCSECLASLEDLQRTQRPNGAVTGHCRRHRVGMLVTFHHGAIVDRRCYLGVSEAGFREAIDGVALTPLADPAWATPATEARPRDLA